MTEGDGGSGKAGQVQPLRELHGVAVSRAGEIVSLAVKKRGTCGNRGEQNGRVLHLAQNLGAEEIAVGAGLRELIERNWISKGCKRKILAQHRADLIFVAGDAVAEQIADHRAEEKPPQVECAIESFNPEGFNSEATLGE